jgi:hypothetical protein
MSTKAILRIELIEKNCFCFFNSAALSLGLGTFVSMLIVLLQHEVRQFAVSGSRFET